MDAFEITHRSDENDYSLQSWEDSAFVEMREVLKGKPLVRIILRSWHAIDFF